MLRKMHLLQTAFGHMENGDRGDMTGLWESIFLLNFAPSMTGLRDDNHALFDEENALTDADDALDEWLARHDEIDLRRDHQADGGLHAEDLQRQVSTMIEQVLNNDEAEIVCDYFGLQRHRLSTERLCVKYGSMPSVCQRLQAAIEKMRYSDQILVIWKYLYRK